MRNGRKGPGAPCIVERFGLTKEFLLLCKKLYLQLNRTKTGGSYAMAVRMAAERPECPPEFRAYIEAFSDRQYLPPSLRDAIDVADAIVRRHRNPTAAGMEGVYTAEVLRMHPREDRRLYAGEMLSSDDGSVNFLVMVPWPWGGDPCSKKFGVRVGRFEVLPMLDCASGYVPSVSWVARPSQSYRAEDLVAALGYGMRQVGLWESAYLERGTWESKRVNEFFRLAEVERLTSYQPRQKLIENWWNTTWTHLSRVPGQIGRFRGEEEEGNRRLRAYQEGRRDPRGELLTLTQAMAVFQEVIDKRNHESINAGALMGSWVPAERWEEDLAERPMRPWPKDLDHLLRPERHLSLPRKMGDS